MEQAEFCYPVSVRQVDARTHYLEAGEAQRAALAARFGLVAVQRLTAEIALERNGTIVEAKGTFEAEIVQSCAVTGDDLPASIREKIALRFVPETGQATPDEEIELDTAELDEIAYEGDLFDLGEAVAQSLALAIDPYATSPGADAARKEAGLLDEGDAGPFAALKGLKTPNP
jgi:uncharacterized metal-binding protein YceD (DUF177 family)